MDVRLPEIGDIVVNNDNLQEYWGYIVESNKDVYTLHTTRIIKKINQNVSWYAFTPTEHIEFLKDPDMYKIKKIAEKKQAKLQKKKLQEDKTQALFEEIAKINVQEMIQANKYNKLMKNDIGYNNIYSVYWKDDGTFKPVAYSASVVYKMVIIARTPEEAKSIASEQVYLGNDTEHFWRNKQYLICKHIGISLDEAGVVCINSQEDTG